MGPHLDELSVVGVEPELNLPRVECGFGTAQVPLVELKSTVGVHAPGHEVAVPKRVIVKGIVRDVAVAGVQQDTPEQLRATVAI